VAHRLVKAHLERCAVDGAARRARLAAHAHLLLGPREQRAEQADDAEEEHRAVGKVQPPHAHLQTAAAALRENCAALPDELRAARA